MNVRRVGVVLVVLLWGGTARAQGSRVYRLFYDAPAECPDRAAFSAAIQSNTSGVRHALAGEPAVSVRAFVTRTRTDFEGTLEIEHPDGAESTRTVPGARCAEAVEAMALIVALTVNPDGQKVPRLEEVEPEASASAASLPPTPYDADYPANRLLWYGAPEADAPPSGRRKGNDAWQFRAGASLGVVSAVGPELSRDYGASLGFSPSSKPLSTFVMLSAHLARSDLLVHAEGTAQFTRAVGRLAACPAVAGTAVLALRPCAFLGVGQLSVMGSEGSIVPMARMPWFELGARLRGEANPWGPLLIGAEFGAAFMLMRDSFHFVTSGTDVFEVPPVSFLAAIDLGLQI